jgi:hypothetical protein
MTGALNSRLAKLETRKAAKGLTGLSDAQLAARTRDLWLALADQGNLGAMPDLLTRTAQTYGVQPISGEAPEALWSRLRPALDLEASRASP